MIYGDPIQVRVREIVALSPALKRFSLQAADGAALPPAAPGAHVTLKLAGPTRVWRNAYSLTMSHADRQGSYDIVVRRTEGVRGGSQHLHDVLREGDVLELTAPANQFAPVRTARKHLMISGGVGVTPFLAFLHALRGGPAGIELHQISAPHEAETFRALLAEAGPAATVHTGRGALDLSAVIARQPLGTHLYVCGPSALMATVVALAQEAGWPAASIHQESFGGTAERGEPFVARLARSGLDVSVGPDDALLDALEAAGVDAPSLCRGGACGQCAVKVLDGTPDHRDHVLSPAERASGEVVLTCVSRACTPILVLDL